MVESAATLKHRRRDPNAPIAQCKAVNRINGQRCRKKVTWGRSGLCKIHLALAKADPEMQGRKAAIADPKAGSGKPFDPNVHSPDPTPAGIAKSGIVTRVRNQQAKASVVILNQQAKKALAKLGQPYDEQANEQRLDPKLILLDSVNSAWRQRQVWEAMLNAVPEEDWSFVGMTPVPGNLPSAKGARIEAIQKFLLEATKVAARTSKLAIDAGIEERLVRLAEEQSALIADTVRAGVVAAVAALVRQLHLNADNEQLATDAALGSAANYLRRLSAGGDEIVDGVATVVSPKAINKEVT